ncbi:MAG: GAF domain-containing protein, partial [Verrucomicrobia bacterium]|nr:GAF domain-containing protein [Verrucomicrobiota bacterium]
LVHAKTGGNPFFVLRFLYALADEGLLIFDHTAGCWHWNLDLVKAKGYADNVVDLMVGKLARLPAKTQKALQQFACVGNASGVETLSLLLEIEPEEVEARLWEAVRQEYVAPVKALSGLDQFRDELRALNSEPRTLNGYKFVHDRVQEAVYSLIPEQWRPATHLRIGRLMLVDTRPERREEAIFDIVHQFNRGASLIESREERELLAELNLTAGKRASASAAYASALSYFALGAMLLPSDTWECRRELIFNLELNRAECEFLTGALAEAEQRLAALSNRATNSIEQAAVACLSIDLYTTLGQTSCAVDVGLEYLRQLGLNWPAHPSDGEARREYEQISSRLGNGSIEDLIEAPLMTDPGSLATLDVLTRLGSAVWHIDANLPCLAVCQAVNLSLARGNGDGSCSHYVWLGCIAGPRFGDYAAAFRLGQLGCQLVERRGLKRYEARTYLIFGAHVMPFTKHFRAGRDILRRALQVANKTGDVTFAGYCHINLSSNLFAAGDSLVDVQRETEFGLSFVQKARFDYVVAILSAQLGLVLTLRGLTPRFGSFAGAGFDELEIERRFASNPNLIGAEISYRVRKLQACFFAGNYVAAVEESLKAQRMPWTASSHFVETAEHRFYGALAQAACWDSANPHEQAAHFEALVDHHRQLQIWAQSCPENFENRAALVGAEIARIEGRDFDAQRLYEKAIRSAAENGFIHVEALAYETAARFYTARGFEEIARLYLKNARNGYLRWGAEGKVRQLDETYSRLQQPQPATRVQFRLGAALQYSMTPTPRVAGFEDENDAPGELDQPGLEQTTAISVPVEQLDLESAVKLSHAVSGEILLQKLIETLLNILVEHAGAERALLILPHGEHYRIEAEIKAGSEGVKIHLHQDPMTASDSPDDLSDETARLSSPKSLAKSEALVKEEVPESLLRYVIRTQEKVILDDASSQKLFSEDPYVRRRRPRSVLCLPLVKQAKLIGVLYVENNLAPGVFTPKRLAMLELLASQAAISLDHARVYAELSRENSERKRAEEELRRSEAFLAQGQKMSHTGSWRWQVATDAVSWSEEHFRIFELDPKTDQPSYAAVMERIHPEDRQRIEELLDRAVRDKSDFEFEYRIVLPNRAIKFLRAIGQPQVIPSGELEFIGTTMDITDSKRAEELQITVARERETMVRQRAVELAKANEALRSCLDALATVPKLDEFIGQVMAAITRQLGAVSSNLRVLDAEENRMKVELIFQDGRGMSPAEAGYPASLRLLPLAELGFASFEKPVTVVHLAKPEGLVVPEAMRNYLLGLGIKTLLSIPLLSRGNAYGLLSFRFAEERDFDTEELEIACALATQASLAIQLTHLARTAKQSAVLEERNRLAGEIHDSLAQNFAGISMQLSAASRELKKKSKEAVSYVDRANELARFGLSEARRSVLSLRSDIIEESGLTGALQRLAERSNIPGLLRCTFRSSQVREESLAPQLQQDLLRIAQEAMSNALRHARPTEIGITLRRSPPDLLLKITDNGSGFAKNEQARVKGFGLSNMRARAESLGARLDITSRPGRGTSVVIRLPIERQITRKLTSSKQ